MITIKSTLPASQKAIDGLRLLSGHSMPEQYSEFLCKYDGAIPEPNIFSIGEDNNSGVNQFIPAEDIPQEATRIASMSSWLLPIAWAKGGNYVILDSKSGEILFWDHELGSLEQIAVSLASFLAKLQPFDANKVGLRPGQVVSAWIDPKFFREPRLIHCGK